jgi:hypothetical protein
MLRIFAKKSGEVTRLGDSDHDAEEDDWPACDGNECTDDVAEAKWVRQRESSDPYDDRYHSLRGPVASWNHRSIPF